MKNLVKVSYLTFDVSPGYTNHCEAACIGVSLDSYADFYAAKDACDWDKECGCFDLDYRFHPTPFRTHLGFITEKLDDSYGCAWVKFSHIS